MFSNTSYRIYVDSDGIPCYFLTDKSLHATVQITTGKVTDILEQHEYIFGVNPAFELIRSERRQIFRAFINVKQKTSPRLKRLLNRLNHKQIPTTFCNRDVLHQKSGSREHQGVVIETAPFPYSRLEDLWNTSRLLLIDNVEDPHNLGAILRNAEVFGFSSIFISKKGVPEVYPSVVKASAGATEYLNISKVLSANDYVKKAKERQYSILALDARGNTTLSQLSDHLTEKYLLVIGGEDKGVGQFILNEADTVVCMGQSGNINSLNASVAAGIALYMLSRKKQEL